MTRRLNGLLLAACLLLAPGSVSRGQSPDAATADPVTARAFEVHYRTVSEAAELIGELLSEDGSMTLKPRLGRIVIEDRASVLKRVAALLESYDLPPRKVEVTLSLFLGTREEDETSDTGGRRELSREVRGMVETLGDVTRWTSYEPLGSRSVSGVEGEAVVANLSGDYRVAFTVASVHERQGVDRVRFERFSLQREVSLGDGGRRVEDLYTAGMVVDAKKLTLVVAAAAPDSKRALFLALSVDPR